MVPKFVYAAAKLGFILVASWYALSAPLLSPVPPVPSPRQRCLSTLGNRCPSCACPLSLGSIGNDEQDEQDAESREAGSAERRREHGESTEAGSAAGGQLTMRHRRQAANVAAYYVKAYCVGHLAWGRRHVQSRTVQSLTQALGAKSHAGARART